MDIRFIGYGGAFDTHLTNSSIWFQLKGEGYLIDCGHSVFAQLVNTGYASKIDNILITHLHDDHVGSLSSYILYRFHVLDLPPVTLWVPDLAFREKIEQLLSHSLGNPAERIVFKEMDTHPAISSLDTFGMHVKDMQTYAYFVRGEERDLAYSGDLGNCDYFFENLKEAKLNNPLVLHEISFNEAHYGHTYFQDLEKYLPEYEIYGYHCDPAMNPADNKVPLAGNQSQFLP